MGTSVAAEDCFLRWPGPAWMSDTRTIYDIDGDCCDAAKKFVNKHMVGSLPPCIIGKRMRSYMSVLGGSCSGTSCVIPGGPQHNNNFNITTFTWYDISSDCCAYFQRTERPPMPDSCPPKKYCQQLDGT